MILDMFTILIALMFGSQVLAVDIMGNPTQYPSVSVDGISYFIRSSTGLILFLLFFNSFIHAPLPLTLVSPRHHHHTATCQSGYLENTTQSACIEMSACTAKYALETIDPLKTEFPTSLVPGRVAGTNSLEIVVQHPAVKGRVVKSIVLNATNAACNYPGENWYHGVDAPTAMSAATATCRDVYTSSIPWPIAASQCGMARNENATHVWFDGVGVVNYDDLLPALDGVQLEPRQVRSIVQFRLVQPKVIADITTSVTTFDEPRLLSAITRQQYDYQLRNATLALVLSLAAPLRTLSLASVTPPSGITIVQSGALNNALCGDAFNATCQQTYTFGVDPGVQCQLDGVYAFTFTVGCHPSVANTPQCPTAMTTLPLSINVTLDSEDICEVVQQLLQVEGKLTSHGTFDLPTFAFGPEKTAFFQEQNVHFQCTVDSLNGFPYESSRLLTVALEDKNGQRQTVYNVDDGGAADGWSFAFDANATRGALTHRHHFVYQPSIAAFGDVLRNQPITSRVFVDVEVRFINAAGPARRRSVIQFELSDDELHNQLDNDGARILRRLRQTMTRNLVSAQVAGQVTVEEDPNAPVATTTIAAAGGGAGAKNNNGAGAATTLPTNTFDLKSSAISSFASSTTTIIFVAAAAILAL
jgi:hypothetical protein